MVLSEVPYIRNIVSKVYLSEFVGTLTQSISITEFYYINPTISVRTAKFKIFKVLVEREEKVKS